MPKYKHTVSWPKLDRDKFMADYHELVNHAIIKAARKFLLAAVPKIPEFTGFARGSLGRLEAIAGRVEGGKIKTGRGLRTKVRQLQPRKYYYRGVERNNVTGVQFANEDIISPGRITKATKGSRIVFNFKIDIDYFDYLDEHKWHAFEAGQKAFNEELKYQLANLPIDISDYITRREYG